MSRHIHSTAVIDPQVRIPDEIEIGPYCVITGDVTLGPGCRLHSHVVIQGPTHIGAGNEFFPFAAIGGVTQDKKYTGEPTYCEIGDRNVFREYVTVHRGTAPGEKTILGSGNLLLAHSHVAHNCLLGNEIILSNSVNLGGHITVEDKAIVSGATAVHQFCRIGRMSIIGGCAKVVQDVPPFMLADGNPAEVKTINKIGLERSGFDPEKMRIFKEAHRILFRDPSLRMTQALDKLAALYPQDPEITHLVDFIRKSERGVCR